MTGDIEKVATSIDRNASWQHIATRIRLSDLKRDRPQLGVESTRLIKIVCGHHYQPEEAHSKGVCASRPVEQRAGNSNKRRTARPHARTNAEKQDENRRTELEEEAPRPRDTFLAPGIYMCAKPSPGYVGKVRQAVRLDRCH